MTLAILIGIVVLTGAAIFGGYHKAMLRRELRAATTPLTAVAEESTIEADGQQARAIDPDNPPSWKTWKGIDGRINCTCHTLPIHTGQRVLFWPIPDHPQGGVDLFCERTVKEAQG